MHPRQLTVFTTSRDTSERIAQKEPQFFQDDPTNTEPSVINIYDDVKYQEFLGFGGAFTEAAADTFYKLPASVRDLVMDNYFDPVQGLGYTFCRTHMNSCDFSLGNYADAEKPGDTALENFNIQREKGALIPMIQEAARRAPFKLFISPWSPPAWMKDNGEMNYGGKLLAQYAGAWAEHFTRFIQALESEGIPVWGLTVQNEPNAVQTWDSCVYTGEEEANFIANHLYPALERHGLERIRIMVWDHNKERVFDRARAVMQNQQAARHVWGIAFHWYSGDHFEALDLTHTCWPDKALIFTEGCADRVNGFNSWQAGEAYAHEIIGDLNNHTRAWCDWNLLLDYAGGPNHVGNYCSAPIMATEDYRDIILQPSYWYIGHFSRFILPGSVRIACTRFTDRLDCTAFLRPDGQVVVVTLNRTDSVIPFVLRWQDQIVEITSEAHSIQSIIF
jgi:glucosylceramidase